MLNHPNLRPLRQRNREGRVTQGLCQAEKVVAGARDPQAWDS